MVGGRTKAFTSAEWLPKANLARNVAIVDAIGIARNIFRGSATSCWLSMCMKGVGSQQELCSSVVVVVVVVGGTGFEIRLSLSFSLQASVAPPERAE